VRGRLNASRGQLAMERCQVTSERCQCAAQRCQSAAGRSQLAATRLNRPRVAAGLPRAVAIRRESIPACSDRPQPAAGRCRLTMIWQRSGDLAGTADEEVGGKRRPARTLRRKPPGTAGVPPAPTPPPPDRLALETCAAVGPRREEARDLSKSLWVARESWHDQETGPHDGRNA
jgi:hypothetical protein